MTQPQQFQQTVPPLPTTGATPLAPRRPINGLGLAALITVIAGFALPLIVFGIGWAITQGTADSVGGFVVGLGFAIAAAAAVAFPLSVVGIVLAIVALLRRDRGKVLAIVSLVLGFIPLAVAGIFFLQIGSVVNG